jgi:alkanesulfonate monooxygenase
MLAPMASRSSRLLSGAIGLGHRPLVGTSQSIADDFEAWLDAEATDGFAIIQSL